MNNTATNRNGIDELLDYAKEWTIHAGNNALAFSNSAIQMCFLLNGMACVAILAFLGSVIEHDIKIGCSQIVALMCFVLGCAFASMCAFCSYRHQGKHTNVLVRILSLKEKAPKDTIAKKEVKSRERFKKLAIFCGAISLISFMLGAAVFTLSLRTISSTPSTTTIITTVSEPTNNILNSDELTAEEKIKMLKVLKK